MLVVLFCLVCVNSGELYGWLVLVYVVEFVCDVNVFLFLCNCMLG